MLFVRDSAGVPSVAKWVQVGNSASPLATSARSATLRGSLTRSSSRLSPSRAQRWAERRGACPTPPSAPIRRADRAETAERREDGLGDAVDVAAAEEDLAGGDADDLAVRVQRRERRQRGVVVAGIEQRAPRPWSVAG